ncbi:MAG: homocysteine S-methyltransferase family protein [Lachnospiraceae bacterium]|nr:homocysteine S-methyltransferase family protein [Lachnospiraceae bacterium]
MDKTAFINFITNNIVILDGATGSFLMAAGMPARACTEDWVSEHPDVIVDLQKQYVAAGSNIIYAPTFGANRLRLEGHGLEDKIEYLNQTAVALSKKAACGKALVAGNLSMASASLVIYEDDYFNLVKETYKEQIRILEDAGCDLFAIETMQNAEEARAAVEAAVEVSSLPVMVSMSFEDNGRTLYGDTPEDAAHILTEAGADVVGANCSAGPDRMLPIIQAIRQSTNLHILAKPNAGTPEPGPNGTVVYNLTEDGYAVSMMQLIENGANIVGGCCGTAPSYIEKLCYLTQNMSFSSIN